MKKPSKRKYKELGYTLLLEKYLGKKRILELYLNYAQWGKTFSAVKQHRGATLKNPAGTCRERNRPAWRQCSQCRIRRTPLNTGSSFLGQRIAVIANNLYLHRQIDDSGYTRLTGARPPGKDSTEFDSADTGDDVAAPCAEPTVIGCSGTMSAESIFIS